MAKQMRCWKCGGEMSVDAEMVGTTIDCPHCGVTVTVPGELFGAPMATFTASGRRNPTRKSPAGVAVLNFLFWGAGYVYLGRMWGLWILIPFCLLSFVGYMAMMEPGAPNFTVGEIVLSNIPGIAIAIHAHGMAKEDQ